MIYIKYLKYVLEHKKNVFIECMIMAKEYWNEKYWREGNRKIAKKLFIHAFTHDLSKFLPCEFIPYAKYFYGYDGVELEKHWSYEAINNGCSCLSGRYLKCKNNFNKAWEHHYKNNPHHPEHWIGKDMPMEYVRQMVCDLKAMDRKFGGNSQEYYLKNYYKWDVTHETRHRIEIELDLIKEYNAPICECNEEYYMNIDELIKQSEEHLERTGNIYKGNVKDNINDFLKHSCDKYNLDIYDLVIKAR